MALLGRILRVTPPQLLSCAVSIVRHGHWSPLWCLAARSGASCVPPRMAGGSRRALRRKSQGREVYTHSLCCVFKLVSAGTWACPTCSSFLPTGRPPTSSLVRWVGGGSVRMFIGHSGFVFWNWLLRPSSCFVLAMRVSVCLRFCPPRVCCKSCQAFPGAWLSMNINAWFHEAGRFLSTVICAFLCVGRAFPDP